MKVKFVEPSAHLIASSLALGKNEVVEAWSNRYNSHFSTDGENRINSVYKAHGGDRERDEYVSAAKTVEYAGRGCYEAYARKNSKTDSYEDYIYNILGQRHNCFSADTEVLTADGWKLWPDVAMDDEFATLNKEGEIEYQHPSELIEQDFDGEMVHVDGKGADQLVTPNHRLLACITTTKAGRKKEDFSLIPAEQLAGTSFALRKDGYLKTESSGVGEPLAWLFGFFAGDGRIEKKWNNQLAFHMSKERKINALYEVCKKLGYEVTVRWEEERENTGYFSVNIPADLVPVFRSFYLEDGQKTIPQDIIMSLSREESQALLDGMIDSDGSRAKNKNDIVFDSTSKSLRDAFMQVALHAGLAANEVEGSNHPAGTVNVINGKEATLKRDSKRLVLVQNWLRPEINKRATANKSVTRYEKYTGKVYCATVPNHTLYVRRKGKPSWSGNSVLEHTSFTIELDGISRAATHEIVRHRHFSFSQESQRFVFKEDGLRMVVPPALVERLTDDEQRIYQQALNGDMFSIVSYAGSSDALQQIVKLKNLFAQTMMQANEMRDILKTDGATRKQASEAARALYPNCAATKIVVTGNARSWLEFISKRHSGAADAELQMIAELVWSILRYTMPEVFSDKPAELWLDEAEQKGVQK